MNEQDFEMHEQNDPQEYAQGEVDAYPDAVPDDAEARNAATPSPTEPEMRRDAVPDSSQV